MKTIALSPIQEKLLRSRLSRELRLGQQQITLGEAYDQLKVLDDNVIIAVIQHPQVITHKHVKDVVKSIRALVRQHGEQTPLNEIL